nr:hypothetical protein BaRGS_021223 [Batillaria attramentaria]
MIACLTELSFRSATYPAYSPVDITCLITASASFSSVAVFKIAPGPEVQLSVFSNPESDSVFDMSWNNTEVRCDVSDPGGNSVTFPLLIISDDFCLSFPVGSRVTHPYSCNRYIDCFGSLILISRCPDDTCYNANTDTCDPK